MLTTPGLARQQGDSGAIDVAARESRLELFFQCDSNSGSVGREALF